MFLSLTDLWYSETSCTLYAVRHGSHTIIPSPVLQPNVYKEKEKYVPPSTIYHESRTEPLICFNSLWFLELCPLLMFFSFLISNTNQKR